VFEVRWKRAGAALHALLRNRFDAVQDMQGNR